MKKDDTYMSRCYELAKIAESEGEAAVGSVVVLNGVIVGEGTEKSRQLRDVTRHAEVVAILDALQSNHSLEGATLYTNMEPCILCSVVIRHHKIGRVVFAKRSGELGGSKKPFNILTTVEIEKWGSAPVVKEFG